MKLGIIAGNRSLPLLLSQRIKEKDRNCEITAICFKGETSKSISKYVDKTYWLKVGKLRDLKNVLKEDNLSQCIMAGQINPMHIFRKSSWDKDLTKLIDETQDFRPHTIFNKIIESLQSQGVTFLDSTFYLKKDLAQDGDMTGFGIEDKILQDIDFGRNIISDFVELDVGQTVVVKNRVVIALESLEGTDRTIKRASRLAGKGCSIVKFSKVNQDLRFDVPVVGLGTLRLLRNIKAASLVLEKNRVLILGKEEFLSAARKWKIAVIGKERLV